MALKRLTFNWQVKMTLVLTGQVFSLLGSGLVQFSIIWWLTQKTNSTVILSLSALTGLLPVILLSPIAGVIADRVNRRLIMMLADGFIALITLFMAVFMSFGIQPVWLIFVLLFLRAIGSAFHQPAFDTITPLIAPEQHLVRTAAVTQMLQSGIGLLSPLLGALLVDLFSLDQILMIDVVTACFAILLLVPLSIPDVALINPEESNLLSYLSDLKSGLRYVIEWKGLLTLIIVFSLANFLLAPMLSLMPLIITRTFNGGAKEYGLFEMALSLGVIAGSLSLSIWGGFKKKILSINIAQIISGLSVLAIALVPEDRFFIVLILIAICGLSSAYINSPATAIMQAQVEKHMQGRVMSIAAVICMASMPLSLAISGPLANIIGLMPLVFVPGLISVIIGVLCFFIPSLMQIEDKKESDQCLINQNHQGHGDNG